MLRIFCFRFRLYSEDGSDYQLITQSPIPGGSTVIYVPSEVVLSSDKVVNQFGNSLQQAESVLVQMDQGTQARLPLFRLMVKILAEYDAGQDSPFYPWLNSLPKQYYNGVSMTDACFDCLPPYAGWLVRTNTYIDWSANGFFFTNFNPVFHDIAFDKASNERINYLHFANALRKGYVPLSQETLYDEQVVKWAYNVALTRFNEIWQPSRQKLIAPMADMVSRGITTDFLSFLHLRIRVY